MYSIQQEICKKYGASYLASPPNLKLGISLNVKQGKYPIHGLRNPVEGDTTGWYIWSGEYSNDKDFFSPLHIKHINDWDPIITKYLGLAPSWRFLIAPDYEDVWYDENLLNI